MTAVSVGDEFDQLAGDDARDQIAVDVDHHRAVGDLEPADVGPGAEVRGVLGLDDNGIARFG